MFVCHSCKEDFEWSEGRMWTCFCVFCTGCMKDAQNEFAAKEKVFSCAKCNRYFDESCPVLAVGEPVAVSVVNTIAVCKQFSEWLGALDKASRMLDVYERRKSFPVVERQMIEAVISVDDMQAVMKLAEVAERWKNAWLNLMQDPKKPGFEEAIIGLGRMLPPIPDIKNAFEVVKLQTDVYEITFQHVITAAYKAGGIEICILSDSHEWHKSSPAPLFTYKKEMLLPSGQSELITKYDIRVLTNVNPSFIDFTCQSTGKVIRYPVQGNIHTYTTFGDICQTFSIDEKIWYIVMPEAGQRTTLPVPSGGWLLVQLHPFIYFLTRNSIYRYAMTGARVDCHVLQLPFRLDKNNSEDTFVTETFILVFTKRTVIYHRFPDDGWVNQPNDLVVTKFYSN